MKRGLTLIELLVAMILSVIVVFIAIQMITGEKKSYSKTREKVRLQTDSREGIRIMEQEIKNAGFRIKADINGTTKELTTGSCAQAEYPSGESFDPDPSTTIYGSTGLEIRSYNPPITNCVTDVWTVGYKYDATAKILYRQAVQGDPSLAANALSASNWVPFLEGVTAFSVNYGVLQENAPLLASTSMTPTSATDWNPASATPSLLDFTNSNSSSSWIFQNTAPGANTAVFKKIALASSGGGAPDGARADALDYYSTYRIGFNVSANTEFFDATKGLAALGSANDKVICGFFDGTGTAISTFTFRPVSNGVVHAVQFDLVPAAASATKLYFGIKFQLQNSSAATRTLTISSLNISRLNKGKYAFSSTIPTDRTTVQALELAITVKSKNETLNFDRIIPMVNNGL